MLNTILIGVMFAIGLALVLNFWVLIRGPEMADRLLALDTMYINSIAMLLTYGVYTASNLHFEAALLIAMLGFVSTVAVCKYMLRGDIIE